MKKLISVILLLLFFQIVSAEESEEDPFSFVNDDSISDEEKISKIKEVLITQLPIMKADFNADSSLPQPLKFILNNEKINIPIGENFSVGLLFKDGKIEYLEPEAFDEPDFNVYISEKFLLELHQEKADFKQSINDGEITFEGIGLFNKLKLFPVKLLLKIL